MTKYCPKCGEIKPPSAFSKARTNKDGLRTDCKVCTSAYVNERYHDEGLILRCPVCGGIEYFANPKYLGEVFCCRCAKYGFKQSVKVSKSAYSTIKKDTERLAV